MRQNVIAKMKGAEVSLLSRVEALNITPVKQYAVEAYPNKP